MTGISGIVMALALIAAGPAFPGFPACPPDCPNPDCPLGIAGEEAPGPNPAILLPAPPLPVGMAPGRVVIIEPPPGPTTPPFKPGPAVPDLIFAEVVEHFVIDSLPRKSNLRTLDAITDCRTAYLIRKLACSSLLCGYECRESATSELRKLGMQAFRALAWATRHRDPEIRDRARKLIDEMIYCPCCLGTGFGEYWYGSGGDFMFGDPALMMFHDCDTCGGNGLIPD